MKKLMSFLLVFFVEMYSYAYDFQYGGLAYNITDNAKKTVEVTSKGSFYDDRYSGDIVIPSSVIYNSAVYSVTRVGYQAFWECRELTSVILPDGLESIGEEAFAECENLTVFTIPNSVTTIDHNAFAYCFNIKDVVIPEHVTIIAPGAFGGCPELTISVSENNSKYDSRDNCNAVIETATNILIVGLRTTTIPNDISGIGDEAFRACYGLESMTIPEGITAIGNGAFHECANLQNIELPSTLQVIGDNAFLNCRSLTSVSIPDYVNTIGRSAFGNCFNLTSVTLGNSVKSIGDNAFVACWNLSSIVIPNSVTDLGACAFSGCSDLENVTLSKNLVNVGAGAFDQTPWYNALKETWDSKYYNMVYINDIAYEVIDKSQTTYKFKYGTKAIAPNAFYRCAITSVTIPEGVTSIGSYAFGYCSSLTDVVIPEGVTNIGSSAFAACPWYKAYKEDTNNVFDNILYINDIAYTTLDDNRVSCTFKEGTKSIAESAFSSCRNLVEVNIPEGVTAIGRDAFISCNNLSKVVLPSTIATIDFRAFYWCDNLAEVTCLAEDVPEGSFIFAIAPDATLYVPESSVETYSASNTWNGFSRIVGLGPEHDTDISDIANTIYLDNCEAFCGKTIELPVKMKNDIAATGFQFDIILPEGITAVQDEDGFYDITLSTDRTTAAKTNTFDSSLMSDGSIRVLAASTRNYAFSGNDGEVCKIKLNVSEDLPAGDYPIILKNIELTNAQGQTWNVERLKRTITVKDYQLGDANGDGRVSVGDFSAIANHILGSTPDGFNLGAADANHDNNISVGDLSTVATMILTEEAGGASMAKAKARRSAEVSDPNNYIYADPVVISEDGDATIVFNMKNAIAATGFQFNFKLPEGFVVTEDEDGFLDVFLSQTRTTSRKTNTFDCVKWSDGSYRVLAASTKNYEFSDNDGEVVTVHIKKTANVESGDYALVLTDIELTNAQGETFRTTKASYTITMPSNSNEVELVDGEPYDNPTTTTCDKLTFTKTFSASAAGNWNAFYVPISVDVEEYVGELDFAEIYAFCATVDTNGDGVVDANDDNFLFVRPVKTGSIKPNVPYLIRPREAKIYVINSADNVLHKATEGKVEFGTTIEKYIVTGLNNSFTVTAGDNNFYVSATGKLNYRTTGSTTVKANRWIMHRESQEYGGGNNNDIAGAKEYRIITIGEDMDEATAIKAINASNANNSGVYTLDGRRVNDAQALPNGIYIKNGKKIFINN